MPSQPWITQNTAHPEGVGGSKQRNRPYTEGTAIPSSLDSRAQVTAQFLYSVLEPKDKTPTCCRHSFASLNETPALFLTWKNEEFYLHLNDNNQSWHDHHYLHLLTSDLRDQLCDASLWNWTSRGPQLSSFLGRWQIEVAPQPRQNYCHTV